MDEALLGALWAEPKTTIAADSDVITANAQRRTRKLGSDSLWTDERCDRLKAMWADGYSASRVAHELDCGLSRSAVIGKIYRLGLCKRREPRPAKIQPPRPRKKYRSWLDDFPVKRVFESEPPPAPRVADQDIPVTQRRTLMTLADETCRWPVGDPGNPDFFFCGAIAEDDRPYCKSHCAVAYRVRPSPLGEYRHKPSARLSSTGKFDFAV